MLPKSVIILIFTLFIVLPTTYFVVKHLKSQQSQSQNQSGPTQPPITCGNTTCSSGEDCIQLSNLNPDTYTNLINTKGSEITSHDDITKSLTFCHKPTSNLTVQNALPSSIQTNQSNYPYYNFEIPVGDKVGLCIPNSVSSTDTTCFSKGKTDCSGNCQWAVLPDNYDKTGGLVDTQVKNYMNFKNNSSQGYYCDPNISLGKVSQLNATNWKDCISQVANQGTIDANWDDTNKVCNLFQVPPYTNNTNQPTQKIQCNASGSPCANCKSDTDFVNAVRCTGAGVPCTNCYKAGDYICDTCQPPTNTNGWNFTTCAPNDSNGNTVQVVSYGSGSGSGNCPWGCSSVNGGGNCYNVGIPTGSSNVFGQPLGEGPLDIVCMQDGQIRSEPNNPTFHYDDSQGSCVQDVKYVSTNYTQKCDCIKNNQKISVSSTTGFVAYSMSTDGKKWYMYYDPNIVVTANNSPFNYTTNFFDTNLSGGNVVINSGKVSINNQQLYLQTAYGNTAGYFSFTNNGSSPYSGFVVYPLILQNSSPIKLNYAYNFYCPQLSTNIDNFWVNNTLNGYNGADLPPNFNPKLNDYNNYIYFTKFELEKDLLNC